MTTRRWPLRALLARRGTPLGARLACMHAARVVTVPSGLRPSRAPSRDPLPQRPRGRAHGARQGVRERQAFV